MRLFLSILLVVTATPQAAGAGAGLAVFDLATGARSGGMGMSGTSHDTDPAGGLLNPAAIAAGHGVVINSAYASWGSDVDHFVNAFSWAGPAGPVTLGGGLTHSRLEFKSYESALGYLPRNTQSSYMTATTAARWSGARGSMAAGVSVAWNTSEDGGDDTRFDAGLRAEGPPAGGDGWSARYALGVSALHNGTAKTSPPGDNGFAPGAGAEAFRYGASLALETGVTVATIQADAIDAAQDGSVDAVTGGVEVSLLDTVHLRAGYGGRILDGRDAVTLGAGAGYRIGDVEIRLDYARVATTGDEIAANLFGARIAFDVGGNTRPSQRGGGLR